jgi:membrane dipeptidase
MRPGWLTDFGRALLAEADRLGVLVDLSHLGFRSSMEIIERTRTPVEYSHANPKALAEHTRNVADEQMRACVATGGLVAVTGIGRFLGDPDATSATLVRAIELTVERAGVANVGIGLDYSGATGSSGLRDPLFWPRRTPGRSRIAVAQMLHASPPCAPEHRPRSGRWR